VSYRIELAGQTLTVTKTLIKPYAVEMATCVLGEEFLEKLGRVNFSNNPVKCCVQDLSATDRKLVSRLKSRSAFPLQLEE
jgi:hypothetical protein